jgi:hypothetical protein
MQETGGRMNENIRFAMLETIAKGLDVIIRKDLVKN